MSAGGGAFSREPLQPHMNSGSGRGSRSPDRDARYYHETLVDVRAGGSAPFGGNAAPAPAMLPQAAGRLRGRYDHRGYGATLRYSPSRGARRRSAVASSGIHGDNLPSARPRSSRPVPFAEVHEGLPPHYVFPAPLRGPPQLEAPFFHPTYSNREPFIPVNRPAPVSPHNDHRLSNSSLHRASEPEAHGATTVLGDVLNENAAVTTVSLPRGPLTRDVVLPRLLQIGASKSEPSELLNFAEGLASREEVQADIDLVCHVLVECASQLLPKSCAFAVLVAVWAFPPSAVPRVTVDDAVTTDGGLEDVKPSDEQMPGPPGCGAALAAETVRVAVNALENYLMTGRIMEARNVLCFLFELSHYHVVSPDSVVDISVQLIQLVVEMGASEDAQGDADYVAKSLLLGSLPWLSRGSADTSVARCVDRLIAFVEESCTRDGRGLLLREALCVLPFLSSLSSGWGVSCKTLPRVLSAAAIPVVKVADQQYCVASIPSIRLVASDVRAALSRERVAAALRADGGFSLDVNCLGGGAWGARHRPLWDDTFIAQHLGGVRPLEPLDRWVLRQLFESIIYAFRHTHALCAEALLRLPVAHDQFELELVDCVFAEMLRAPRSLEPCPIFYFRLLQSLVANQKSILPLVHDAIYRLVLRTSQWDPHVLATASQFFAFWFSGGSGIPNVWAEFDFSLWTPDVVNRSWCAAWVPFGHVLISLADVFEDEQEALIEEQLPQALCQFLGDSFNRLSQLVAPDALRARLPQSLVGFVPRSTDVGTLTSGDDRGSAARSKDRVTLEEYSFLRRVFLHRFESEAHRKAHTRRLVCFIQTYLVNKPRLALPPCDVIVEFLRSVPSSEPVVSAATAPEDTSMTDLVKPEEGEDAEAGTVEAFVKREDEGVTGAEGHDEVTLVSIEAETEPVGIDVKKQEEDTQMSSAAEPSYEADLHSFMDRAPPLTYSDNTDVQWSAEAFIQVFMHALLIHGEKSFTHTSRALANYHEVLAALRPEEASAEETPPPVWSFGTTTVPYAEALLRIVFDLADWRSCTKRMTFVIKLLIRQGLLSAEATQEFIFDQAPVEHIRCLPIRELAVWIVRHAALQLAQRIADLQEAHASSPHTPPTTNGDCSEPDAVAMDLYRRLCSLVSRHLFWGIRRLIRDGMKVDNDMVEVVEASRFSSGHREGVDESWDKLPTAQPPLLELISFGRCFLHFLDMDSLQESLDVTMAQSPVTRLLLAHLRELQHYLYPTGTCRALAEYISACSVSVKESDDVTLPEAKMVSVNEVD